MHRRVPTAVLLVATLLLAGCAAPYAGSGSGAAPAPGDAGDAPAERPDPDEDRLGWEHGYWHNESLSIDASDGLNDSELEAVTYRTMARLEVIRGLEFERDPTIRRVPLRVARERAERDGEAPEPGPFDQLFEATFVVGEDRSWLGVETPPPGGFYSADEHRITLIVDESRDGLRVDRSTLAHELVHALESDALDAYDDDSGYVPGTVTEGDADYVTALYGDRCGGRWDCMPDVSEASDSAESSEPTAEDLEEIDANLGLLAQSYFPYAEGPDFVKAIRERGGWAAVNDLYENPPASAEQVIHPERYPDEDPVYFTVPDRSDDDWEREPFEFTVGEARLYTTLWDNGVVDRTDILSDDVGGADFSHPATDGWGGDLLVPYTNGSAYGYVFVTVWDSERDAREFHAAYLEVLAAHDATEVRDGVYRIPDDDPFGDAFRVVRDGDRVVVTNAPTVADLDAVRDQNASVAD